MNPLAAETLADVAYTAGYMRVICKDSRELMSRLIEIAADFDTLYESKVASGEWDEGEYMTQVDDYATEQFELRGLKANQNTAWNDGETEYCAGLVDTDGDDKVPRHYVQGYLELQLNSARRADAKDAVVALSTLVSLWGTRR